MSKKSDYSYVVVSTDENGKLDEHISHYLFKSHDKALDFKTELQGDTANRLVILAVLNMR